MLSARLNQHMPGYDTDLYSHVYCRVQSADSWTHRLVPGMTKKGRLLVTVHPNWLSNELHSYATAISGDGQEM